MKVVEKAIEALRIYIEKSDYRGYDPYDGLMSPLFKIPFLNSHKTTRFLWQQFVKRFPLNIRKLLLIKKGYNPVTLGLCIQGYARLAVVYPNKREEYRSKISFLIEELRKLIPEGYSGACWGYDFHWAARYADIPAYQPTVVATGMITNALFIAYKEFDLEEAKALLISSSKFVINDLNRTEDQDGSFCFSYSPFDKQVVFNASMKGARLLSQVYTITKDKDMLMLSEKAIAFVMKHQQPSGSWIYSKSAAGGWVDNYHTGYVLDSADDYTINSNSNRFKSQIELGYKFYSANFIEKNGAPKFYDKHTYPIDCTAAAQSMLTLTRFNNLSVAYDVATYMINNMQDKKGFFYFRKYKYFTRKTSFMRWSNAWMFAGLTEVLYYKSKGE